MKQQKSLLWTILLAMALAACGPQTVETPPATVTSTPAPVQPTQSPTTEASPTAITVDVPTEIPAEGISFANEVMPIFNTSCNKCHGSEEIKEGLDMRTYETLMAGSFNGPVIAPGNADDSFLVQQLIDGEMPKRGPKLSAEQIQVIIDWINQGAINN